MPVALTDTERDAILADVRAMADGTAPERSAGSIARAHNRARSTVTRLAEEAGLGHVWQRTKTAGATRARVADNRSRRAALATGFLDDVDLARQRLRETYTFAAATKEGIDQIELQAPPASEFGAFVRAAKTALDAHLAVDKVDNDGGEQEARSAVAEFIAAIQASGPTEPAAAAVQVDEPTPELDDVVS